mmetsp:Transcript_67105/g.212360  ORF Transcript_67105/g.212360 Transcript_67105/m.212360 type:complete len:305 (+) Transcript_67105:419-1333(+)
MSDEDSRVATTHPRGEGGSEDGRSPTSPSDDDAFGSPHVDEAYAEANAAADDLADLLHGTLAIGEDAASSVRKTLVLIDCNGFLLFRDTKNVVPTRFRPDFIVPKGRRQERFFVRPDALQLVSQLLNDPRCVVSICSSIYERNLAPAIEHFDRYNEKMVRSGQTGAGGRWDHSDTISISSGVRDGKIHYFDAEYQGPDPEGENEWDTMRDLNRIWCSGLVPGFDESNTLLIEAEERKARDWAHVCISPSEYDERAVVDTLSHGRPARSELRTLSEYLDNVLFPKMQDHDNTVEGILSSHPCELP